MTRAKSSYNGRLQMNPPAAPCSLHPTGPGTTRDPARQAHLGRRVLCLAVACALALGVHAQPNPAHASSAHAAVPAHVAGAVLEAPIAADSGQWPVVDGRCNDRIYAGADEGLISLAPYQLNFATSVYTLQTEREVHVCMANLPRDGSDSAAVYFDRAHDGGTWAGADDLMIVVQKPTGSTGNTGMAQVTTWKGDGLGGYLQINLPFGSLRAAAVNVDDLTWDLELAIGRGAVLGTGVAGRLGFAAQAKRIGGEPCDCDPFGPVDARWNRPDTWGDLIVDPVPYAVIQSPVADTFADSGEPSTVEGQLTYLLANYDARRIFVRFAQPPLPNGSQLQDLRLRLYGYDGDAVVPRRFQICPVTQAWSETALTWSNQPAVAAACFEGYDREAFPPVSTLGHGPWYTWPITTLAQTRLDVASTYGLRLMLLGDGTEDRTFGSRENATDPHAWPELAWLYYLGGATPTPSRTMPSPTSTMYSTSTTPTATPTASSAPTYTPTHTPTTSTTSTTPSPTPTTTPSATPTSTPTSTPTFTPTSTSTSTSTWTSTSTPSPTASPTPTATAFMLQVSGRVVLERRASSAGAQVCAGAACATTAADGRFALAAQPGSELRVRHPSYLAAWRTLPMTGTAPLVLPPVALLAGDLNQDGKVEVDDAAMVGQRFNLRFNPADPAPTWLEAVDITDDDVIDIRDMVGVQFNLQKRAPGPWPDSQAAR